MSLVETLHAEHKARMARFAQAAMRPIQQPPVIAKPVAVAAPVIIPPRKFDAFEEYAWRMEIEGIEPQYRAPSIYEIRDAVCLHFGVRLADLISSRRTRNLTLPRHVSYYLGAKLTLQSLPEIGRRHGGRDHTTVLHGVKKITRMLATDSELQASVEMLKRRLGAHEIADRRKVQVKLTEEAVRAIRGSTLPQPVLAEKYGVSPCSISAIKAWHTWKNVE